MSPVSPSLVSPGVRTNRCQMLGPAPSASGDPSIWYADVAAPQRKDFENSYVMAPAAREIYRRIAAGTTGTDVSFWRSLFLRFKLGRAAASHAREMGKTA